MTNRELRRSPRVRPGGIVRVTFLERSFVDTGTLVDISETGMGLLVEAPVEPGTTLHVELNDQLVVGSAVYCRVAENGYYRVGLRLLNRLGGSAWDAMLRKWQPSTPVLPAELPSVHTEL
jgi:PilZ domain